MITEDKFAAIMPEIEIIKKFPESGQKNVFLVKHEKLGIVIAKVFKSGDERIEREIEIITENSFANVPKILDLKKFDDKSGSSYICLFEEFIEGETLKDKISKGTLNITEGFQLLETLLDIVISLEKVGIVHRDIKPDNIICVPNGQYYLIDFGIARHLNQSSLTFSQAQVGPHTPGYGAPELFQYSKKDIDSRTDLFSIGVVIYEAMSGSHPFVTGNEIDYDEIWYKTQTIVPSDIVIDGDKDKQLISYIQVLMQKHITRRPSSAKKAKEWFKAVVDTIGKEGI